MGRGLSALLLRRVMLSVPLVLAVVTLTFFLIRLAPGDPALILAGDAPTPEVLARIRAEYGLDQSQLQQFLAWIAKAARGDFGTSIYLGRPVFDVILDRFPATLLLTLASMALASATGIALGVMAAQHAGTRLDATISAGSLIGHSLPGFWIGQLLVLFFAVELEWLPASGMTSARVTYTGLAYALDVAAHLVLPATTLAIFLLTMIARFTRTAMIEALQQDFILVAAAKGVSARGLLWRHAFRNAVVTTVTVIGLEFGSVLSGAVVTEIVFGWPGLGRVFYDAINRRDFPLLTGAFIFSSVVVIAANTLSDLICAALDPRIRR